MRCTSRSLGRGLGIALGATAIAVGAVSCTCERTGSAQAAPAAAGCAADSGPDDAAVQAAVASIPRLREDVPWYPDQRGQTQDCRLHWLLLSAHGTASTPEQLLFFDGPTFLRTATPEPRPYVTVVDSGPDTVTVRYDFIVGDEPNCCPTGQALVRFRLTPDGAVAALDPIPAA